VTYLDVDDTVRATFGYAKQGAGYGYSGVKGLNALLATVSTADNSAPVIVATRLRKGSANSARGAPRLIADAITTTRSCRVTGVLVLRADSAYYGAEVIAAARRAGVHFSVTARKGSRDYRCDCSYSGDGMDRDPLPPRDLRRTASAVDLRCGGRRNPVHGIPVQTQSETGHRPVDRAPGPRRQPRPCRKKRPG
jgi:hypothetical protein